MKFAAIISGIGLFFAKTWRVIKATGQLKKVAKEVKEAFEEGKQAYEQAQKTIEAIQGYFSDSSDGGKKLTSKEVQSLLVELQKLGKELKEASVEGLQAKDEIKKLIDSVKGSKN